MKTPADYTHRLNDPLGRQWTYCGINLRWATLCVGVDTWDETTCPRCLEARAQERRQRDGRS